MSDTIYQVGTILVNSVGQFTKIISFRNGRYGLSGWVASRTNAEKANVAFKYVNTSGLAAISVQIVKGSAVKPAPAASKVAPTKKPTKAKLSKLSVAKLTSMATKLKLSVSEDKGTLLKTLFAHFEL